MEHEVQVLVTVIALSISYLALFGLYELSLH